ncbi:hypothetical protein V6N11_018379 [Hibiscus sabdariffa]|uniref:Uncharacterized protein n=1 Tax=Hibiscus sabdariffa TaxID=183260 RepID=A0ABR2T796_9ROSI
MRQVRAMHELPQAGRDNEAKVNTERRPVYMHGGSQSRYATGIEHNPIAPSSAGKVTHHTNRDHAARCIRQQPNSMLYKTETELPKQNAILKPQAGQASEVEANVERRPEHPHGDNHLRYGASVEVERSSITPRSA